MPRGGLRGPPGPPHPMMGGPPGGRPPMPKFVVTHHTFDLAQCEHFFPNAAKEVDDGPLTQALLKRNQELTLLAVEQAAIQNLVGKVEVVVENLILAQSGLNIAVEEIRTVGSH